MSYIFLNIPHLLHQYGYIGVFVVVFLESGILFALPGDSLLFTAGLLATSLGLNLFVLIPLVFVATFFGGLGGYVIGVYIEKLHQYAFFRKILKQEYLDKAHVFFERHGRMAIILSRFLAIVRTFVPITAGIARMDLGKFIRFNLVGAFLWSTIMPLLGFFLGRKFPFLKDYISYLAISVIVVSLIPVVYGWYRRRQSSQV